MGFGRSNRADFDWVGIGTNSEEAGEKEPKIAFGQSSVKTSTPAPRPHAQTHRASDNNYQRYRNFRHPADDSLLLPHPRPQFQRRHRTISAYRRFLK